jgi:hypothetical protein
MGVGDKLITKWSALLGDIIDGDLALTFENLAIFFLSSNSNPEIVTIMFPIVYRLYSNHNVRSVNSKFIFDYVKKRFNEVDITNLNGHPSIDCEAELSSMIVEELGEIYKSYEEDR